MANRKKLPHGCWVATFSSEVTAARTAAGLREQTGAVRRRNLAATARRLRSALGSGSLVTRAAASTPQKVRSRRERSVHTHVLPGALFTDALARERSRADRFEQTFSVVRVAMFRAPVGGGPDREAIEPPAWLQAIDALLATVGGTAVLGWVEDQAVLGAIVPARFGADAEAVLRRELVARLGARAHSRFSIRSSVYEVNPAPRPEAELEPTFSSGPLSPAGSRPAHYDGKRAIDIAGSLALIVLFSPAFIVVAALIAILSPGAMIFRQTRVGQMGKPFTMYKFRTMRVDADHQLHKTFVTQFIRPTTAPGAADHKPVYKMTHDPRITPLGRLLRKTSLDELPQLWNVLRGEMSLVGPRPPLALEGELYRPWHWRRVLEAKPGLTGLWQVKGRSRTTFDEMVRLDLQYVRTCCLWTDVKILLATPWAVLSARGAA